MQKITRHAHELWEELVRVPLFVYVPGVAPRVIDTPRGHADLAPTFVELLTYRVSAHSSSDAPSRYRDESVTMQWRTERDPLARYQKLVSNASQGGVLTV